MCIILIVITALKRNEKRLLLMTSQLCRRLVSRKILMRFTAPTHVSDNKYRLSSFQLLNITRCIGCHGPEHDIWRTKWCCRTLKNYDLNHTNAMSRFVMLKRHFFIQWLLILKEFCTQNMKLSYSVNKS